MFAENKKVIINNEKSAFYGHVGTIWNKGNGNMWQVGIDKIGIYFMESELTIVEDHKCFYCDKTEAFETKSLDRDILYHHNFELKDRKGTCRACAKRLSKEGKIPCINRHYHHLGETCQTCGLKD